MGGTGYSHPGYGMQVPNDKGATTALVLGIVSIALCTLAAPFAIFEGTKSRRRIRESNGTLGGDAMALAGLIMGWVGVGILILTVLVIVVVAATTPSTPRGLR
jgi:hypothetical protein